MSLPLVTLTVVADTLPGATWRCRRCDYRTPHACTGRFRVNANGKLLDVWLLYRCTRCDTTHKVPVAERVPVRTTDVDALDAATVARDLAVLRRAGAEVGTDTFRLVPGRPPADTSGPVRLALTFPVPLVVRLEDVVGACLGVSRAAVRRLAAGGAVALLGVDGGWRAARSVRRWSSAVVDVHGGPPAR